MAQPDEPYTSLNCPEENDETRSDQFESEHLSAQQIVLQHDTFSHSYLSVPYTRQTLYPSWHESVRDRHDGCQCSSYYKTDQGDGSPHSLPSCLPSAVYQTISDGSLFCSSRPHSLPGSCSSSLISLELPRSLHSYVPSAQIYPPHPSYPNPYPHPPDCRQFGQPQQHAAPVHHCNSRPGHQMTYRPSDLAPYRQMDCHSSEHSNVSPKPKQDGPNITHLSQEHRKVFVTYEADSDEHLKEIIKFVALLRNNGFDTHIDVFEEQLSSISKIDCMERYLNEKDYLIIIIISLRYYKTVSGMNTGRDDDEKTSNTVYIHRQLQSEFIQNGCRNYRFIPILFPGANKALFSGTQKKIFGEMCSYNGIQCCLIINILRNIFFCVPLKKETHTDTKSYVPSWLRNTHIYSWPKDRDDILLRLMRVEKYNPPPVGPLPTIVPIPL